MMPPQETAIGRYDRLEFLYYVRELLQRASEAMNEGEFREAAEMLRYARGELSLYGQGLESETQKGFWIDPKKHMDVV